MIGRKEEPLDVKMPKRGWPGSVRLQCVHGAVRAVPVFGSDGSSGEGVALYDCTVLQGKARFRFRFLNNSDGSSSRLDRRF